MRWTVHNKHNILLSSYEALSKSRSNFSTKTLVPFLPTVLPQAYVLFYLVHLAVQIFLWSLDDQRPVQRWHRSWLGFISDFSEVEELKQVRRKGNVGFSDFGKVYKHSYQMEAQRKELNGWVQSRRQDFRVCPHGVQNAFHSPTSSIA